MLTSCGDAGSLIRESTYRLQAAGIERPQFEAELLVALAFGKSRLAILTHPELEHGEAIARRLEELLRRRESREPMAHLRGSQDFYGREFVVGPQVLIPRPETELLVDCAREKLATNVDATVIDVGTGSACIAISVACELPKVAVIAVDCSADALVVARENAVHLSVSDRVAFVRGWGLDTLRPESASMIVANPPYIPTDEIETLQPEVREFEPRMALDGGADGLDVIRKIAADSPRVLRSGGWLAVEVGMGQAEATAGLFKRAGLQNVDTRADLAGIGRVVAGQKQ